MGYAQSQHMIILYCIICLMFVLNTGYCLLPIAYHIIPAHCTESLWPDACINAFFPIRYHKNMVCSLQSFRKWWFRRAHNQTSDVQLLWVAQHAAIRMFCSPRPGIQDFANELVNTFSPAVRDKEITVKARRMGQERPALSTRHESHWLYELLHNSMDTRALCNRLGEPNLD